MLSTIIKCVRDFFSPHPGPFTIEMLHVPLSLGTLWDDGEVERNRVGEGVFVHRRHGDSGVGGAQMLDITGQHRAVVVQVPHLDGYGSCGCLCGHV